MPIDPRFKLEAKTVGKVGEMMLYGPIGPSMWDDSGITDVSVNSLLAKMKSEGADELCIFLSSPGGNVFHGTSIYNAIKRWDGKKKVVIDGVAASMGSMIALAADEIEMCEASWMMIHEPSSVAMGRKKDMNVRADQLQKVIDVMSKIYADKTGKPHAEILKLMDAETWMTGSEAVKEGFATKLVESADDENSSAMMRMVASAASPLWATYHNVPKPLRSIFMMGSEPPTRAPVRLPEEKENMDRKMIATSLGLSADASDAEILAAVTSLRVTAGKVESMTASSSALAELLATIGAPNSSEAKGIVLAMKSSHSQVAQLQAAAQAREVKEKGEKVISLVDAGTVSGQIPPAMKDFWIAQGTADMKILETFLAQAPKLSPGGNPIVPKPPEQVVSGTPEEEQDKIFATMGITKPEEKKAVRETVIAQSTELKRKYGITLGGMPING